MHLLSSLKLSLFSSLLHINPTTSTSLPSAINRQKAISRFNPTRNASSPSTPMQVGNGNFAFGADITGLQTFLPYGTLSSWGWHNSSLPGEASPEDFTGLDWWTHGQLVNYEMPNPEQDEISQWLIRNPHRVNLGRVGFHFMGEGGDGTITEDDLDEKFQELDIYRGILTSGFKLNGYKTTVWTCVDPYSDTVSVRLHSELLVRGRLAVFFDYPYATGDGKFEAPFVGNWDAVANHSTELRYEGVGPYAQIKHALDETVYYTDIHWSSNANATIVRKGNTHRYILHPLTTSPDFELTASFSPSNSTRSTPISSSNTTISSLSTQWWKEYWETGAFIDLTTTHNTTAHELHRRIILSQYLVAINNAGHDPPQESGLVNNGWYGKFHLEMYLWHAAHWIPWGRQALLDRSIGVYERFLDGSRARAKRQGYEGVRWGKMSDPSGRSAPGEINSLLIWQQPHVFYFAELEYRAARLAGGGREVLMKWDEVLSQSAVFMATYAFWNESTGVYDLGPPMYPVSENTPPNSTRNPTFELAYWQFGLETAIRWKERLGRTRDIPELWRRVLKNLAPLPTVEVTTLAGEKALTYTLYEGILDMWTDPETIMDHPALTGIYGLLPPLAVVNRSIAAATAAQVARTWNFTDCWGWDFPMLAMNAARLGNVNAAVDYLVHENFQFDDVGMPVGPMRNVPTPYFPSSAGLLLAVGMLAGGWETNDTILQRTAPGLPVEWDVLAEGFMKMF